MPSMIYLPLWNLSMALLFAIVFDRWAGVRTFTGGLKTGALIMLLLAIIMNLEFLAFMNFWKNELGVILNIAASTFIGTLAGGVVGAVLGAMSRSDAAQAA
ncbi:MAG: hypothetical protein JO314_05795 [Acidobacteria bacterium]|nr:hypothetical protein [Acidobacteriota bacterium]